MISKLTSRDGATALVVLSIVYGILVAALGSLESSALTPVAAVGALVVGGGWAIRGVLRSRMPPQA